jgi:ribonuclease Z
MELIFLGTSSGTPTKERNVSAVALRKKNDKRWSLIDCGEGTQHQLLHTNLSMQQLDAIYITHIHGDHCYGLPGLLASASMGGRTEPLLLVAPRGVVKFVESMMEYTELYLTYELQFIVLEEQNAEIERAEFKVEIMPLSHRVPSWGYLFTEKGVESSLNIEKLKADAIPVGKAWGIIQKGQDVTLEDGRLIEASSYQNEPRKARKVAISGDNDDASLWGEVEGLDLLVHESTFTHDIALKIGKEVGHSSAQEVASFANEYGLTNLILTHFSSRYHGDKTQSSSIAELEDEARKFYDKELFLANDFELFELTRDLELMKRVENE